MKNISLLINVVLAIGLAVLYYLHFSAAPSTPAPQPEAPVEEVATEPETSSNIYYINIDSLFAGYQHAIDNTNKFDKEMRRKEARLEQQYRELEAKYTDLQQQLATMSPQMQQVQAAQFQKEEQDLVEARQLMEREMARLQADLTNEVNQSVKEYIDAYVEGKGISFVLLQGVTSPLAYADSTLEITQDILTGLNEQYAAAQAAEAAPTNP